MIQVTSKRDFNFPARLASSHHVPTSHNWATRATFQQTTPIDHPTFPIKDIRIILDQHNNCNYGDHWSKYLVPLFRISSWTTTWTCPHAPGAWDILIYLASTAWSTFNPGLEWIADSFGFIYSAKGMTQPSGAQYSPSFGFRLTFS